MEEPDDETLERALDFALSLGYDEAELMDMELWEFMALMMMEIDLNSP